MINDYTNLNDILDFALSEPESKDDLYEMLKDSSVDTVKKLTTLGLNLVSAGVRVLCGKF